MLYSIMTVLRKMISRFSFFIVLVTDEDLA